LLTNVLAAAERDENTVRALRTQVDSLRSARAALRQEIERRFPSYAQLIDPRPATIEDTRRSLRPGEALIATYVGRERSFVWAVPQSGAVAFAAVDKGQRAIAAMVADLRKALDPNAATLGDIPAFDVGLASRLYDDLLKPVEAGFATADSLLIVPHDALGQLPFGVLVTQAAPLRAERTGEALFANYKDVPFLIRKAAITQLPSVAALSTLRGLPVPPANRRAFVGFGDPWFSPQQAQEARAQSTQTAQLQTRGAFQTRGLPLVRRNAPATTGVDSAELAMLPRLPDTQDEVRGIALALNADPSDVILGAQANERTVKAMDLSNRRVVMFATHGLIPGDLNGLTQPALALSAPNVADVDGDGLLTLDEVLGLKLNADWVVLSACNTATGDGAGAEAVSGLGRAFFYAGTRALLVSNWPVETTSARELTTDLFARQARDPNLQRAQALRQAMTGLIDGNGYVDPATRATAFAYSHPIFWAPFSLVGDGGGSQRQTSEAR
jgi:CHAT domain-containing protein